MSAVGPVSPELALVCPELRQQWLAALPDIDPDRLFRPAATRRAAAPPLAPAREVSLLVAAGAYTAVSVAQWLVWATVTFCAVTVATLVLTLAGL